jgi:hypothetical protein
MCWRLIGEGFAHYVGLASEFEKSSARMGGGLSCFVLLRPVHRCDGCLSKSLSFFDGLSF